MNKKINYIISYEANVNGEKNKFTWFGGGETLEEIRTYLLEEHGKFYITLIHKEF